MMQETSLIGMADAAKILSGKLASQINISVESVGLVYLPLTFENSSNPNEKIFFPCWRFAGVNRVKGENMELYVDALTGDAYYYGYSEDTEYGIKK